MVAMYCVLGAAMVTQTCIAVTWRDCQVWVLILGALWAMLEGGIAEVKVLAMLVRRL